MRRLPSRILPADSDLALRLWRQSDVPALHDLVMRNVEHLRPWMPWIAAEPLTRGERAQLVRTWRADWRNGGDTIYGIFLANLPIGGCGLHRRRGPRCLEIGYWVDTEHCGRGIATAISRLLTSTALEQPGIDVVEIRHDRANTRSGRVPAKLGYVLVAETPDEVTSPGEVGIDCTWQIEASQWRSARPFPEPSAGQIGSAAG